VDHVDEKKVEEKKEVKKVFSTHSKVTIDDSSGGISSRFWHIAVPKLRIVIMAVGTRGDIYPLISLGLRLKLDGHRGLLLNHHTK
jgi:hypothetical protein